MDDFENIKSSYYKNKLILLQEEFAKVSSDLCKTKEFELYYEIKQNQGGIWKGLKLPLFKKIQKNYFTPIGDEIDLYCETIRGKKWIFELKYKSKLIGNKEIEKFVLKMKVDKYIYISKSGFNEKTDSIYKKDNRIFLKVHNRIIFNNKKLIMGVYLSIKTEKLNDNELKEKLSEFYLSSSSIPREFDLIEFLKSSENNDYGQIIKTTDLINIKYKVDKIYNSYEKKFKNLLKILSCIKVDGYINKKNIEGQENTLKYELKEILNIYENFIEKNKEYLKNDKDISDIFEKYLEEVLEIVEYMDNVIERFKTSYKNEDTIYNEVDYLFGEIYTVLRFNNFLKIAKKYDLELNRG